MSTVLPTLTLFGLGAIAWTICDHVLTRSGPGPASEPPPIPGQVIHQDKHVAANLAAVEPDADAGTDDATVTAIGSATILAAMGGRDAYDADAVQRCEQLLVRLHTECPDREGRTIIRQTHLALSLGDRESMSAAYQAIKQPMRGLSADWQVVTLCQETLLSLEVATRDGNAAAAYRGLESLRKLRLASFHGAPLDAMEDQLRAIAIGTSRHSFSTAQTASDQPMRLLVRYSSGR